MINAAVSLSTTRCAALYVGALLGPALLLLPGLAAALAGPASILDWIGLLAVSGLLARVFVDLGARFASGDGAPTYTAAGLGERAGRAVGWCFLLGVVLGAPVVCLIGGSYVAALSGGGREVSVLAAALVLIVVVALTFGGARAASTAQLALVAVLVALVAVAVAGSASAARAARWTPFAPHGWAALGNAASVLMLSFVGWEAIAPLTERLHDPRRQLPRVIGIAFTVTTVVYLALAAATIAVLGAPPVSSAVPLADLLRVAVGPAGPVIAAVAAVALTLAATNAYLAGAAALASRLRAERPPVTATPVATTGRTPWWLQLGVAAAGVLLLGGVALGAVTTVQLVVLPTTLFLTVYLGCTASAARILRGRVRFAAAAACAAVLSVLAFSGWALVVPLAIVVVTCSPRRGELGRRRSQPSGRTSGSRRRDGVAEGGDLRCEP
ncbi:MAG: amino acid transporter [Pseudonocardiales bacterium]|nr:MAG: amino acid transporter [Pseudonocardiales bacterium]